VFGERLVRILHRWLWVAGLASLIGCDPKADPKADPELEMVTPKEAEALSPSDLGVGKFVFEVKVPADKVMVLRMTEQEQGRKGSRVLESIQYTDGGVGRQVVLMFDSSEFPFGERGPDQVRIKAQAATNTYGKHTCKSWSMRPGRLTLVLSHPDGATTITYDCFLEEYAAAKKRVPTLSDAKRGETWTHNHTPDKE
jgi:hypothetical protein